jgi:predicted Rossmann fold flavoprotein
MNEEKKRLIVIGGGAAGFFAAINASIFNKQLEVILLEKHTKVLQKVKVSGGGRCNVTHHCFDNNELVEKYPRGKNFIKKTLSKFSVQDTIQWFADRGVALHTEADGRMFPTTNQSETIVECLLSEAIKNNIDIRYNSSVVSVEKKDEKFHIHLQHGKQITSDYVCVASGGYQTLLQYDWLHKLQHTIIAPVPSLFTFNIPNSSLKELMGLSVPNATIKIVNSKLQQSGPLLITHWGLSGPCVLKLSAWGARELADSKYDFSILVSWVEYTEQQLREQWNAIRNKQGQQLLQHKNPFELPTRLWKYFLEQADIKEEIKWSELPAKLQNKLITVLTAQLFHVKGKTTFKEEFVTCGGIALAEVDSNTMMSRKTANLFFAGEILDIDGVTGGFNFQNAWTTGYIVAKALEEK